MLANVVYIEPENANEGSALANVVYIEPEDEGGPVLANVRYQ